MRCKTLLNQCYKIYIKHHFTKHYRVYSHVSAKIPSVKITLIMFMLANIYMCIGDASDPIQNRLKSLISINLVRLAKLTENIIPNFTLTDLQQLTESLHH